VVCRYLQGHEGPVHSLDASCYPLMASAAEFPDAQVPSTPEASKHPRLICFNENLKDSLVTLARSG
jgi:hypothetical protein